MVLCKKVCAREIIRRVGVIYHVKSPGIPGVKKITFLISGSGIYNDVL